MVTKKVAVMLAIIALVLVIIVITVNVSSSKQIPVVNSKSTESINGNVGVTILPSSTEDRGNNS